MNYENRRKYLDYLHTVAPRYAKLFEKITDTHVDTIDLSKYDNVWLWSDLHFFHKNIIEYSHRPFDDVHQMNWHLMKNHMDYVGENDICFWLGDVTFYSDEKTNAMLSQLKGYNVLIQGNHDFNKNQRRVLNFSETRLMYEMEYDGIQYVMTHYPIVDTGLPVINIHGHQHIKKPDVKNPACINVCCELHKYRPINMKDIHAMAQIRVRSFHEQQATSVRISKDSKNN